MPRFAILLTCSLVVISSAHAGVLPRDPLERTAKVQVHALKPLSLTPNRGAFCITDATEVLVNGQPCKYAEVPGDAVILRLEIASPTSKEILKIYFKSATGLSTGRGIPQVESDRSPMKQTTSP
jgi:hypothetical protein